MLLSFVSASAWDVTLRRLRGLKGFLDKSISSAGAALWLTYPTYAVATSSAAVKQARATFGPHSRRFSPTNRRAHTRMRYGMLGRLLTWRLGTMSFTYLHATSSFNVSRAQCCVHSLEPVLLAAPLLNAVQATISLVR